jgi:hypothetical protein
LAQIDKTAAARRADPRRMNRVHDLPAEPARGDRSLGALARRLADALAAWWRRGSVDDPSDYLAGAVDAVDLQDRMRRWNETERHDRLPLR